MRKIARQILGFPVLMAVFSVGVQASITRDSDAAIGDVTFAGDSAVLPLMEHELHPRVSIDLGDGELYEFIVDTGASVNVIDSSIAERLKYDVVGETEIGAPGGPQVPANIIIVPLARVGTATISNAEFVTMDILGFSGGNTHGVLGVRLFSDFLLTFDRGAGHIELSNDSLSANERGVISYDSESTQIEIKIDVAGTAVAAHVDTGSMGEFTLPGEMMNSLSLQENQSATKAKMVGGERDIKFAQLDGNIEFADFEFKNPNIAFMTPSPGSGNIGSGILADYIVSIDQKSHLIEFRKPADGGAAVNDNKPRRLGVRFRGMPGGKILTIANVELGSLGEKSGLMAGDVLLKLNDKPTDQYGMSDLGALFGSRAPLKFELERDGEAITIEFQ